MNRATRALEAVQSRPGDAARWARELLADPTCTAAEQATANWALGRAWGELGQLDDARSAFEEGLRVALGTDQLEVAAEIRVSLASCLLHAGATTEALAELDAAEPDMRTNGAKGRLVLQRGLISYHLGDLDESLARFDQADEYLALDPDKLSRIRLLVNRGVANTVVGHLSRAETDLVTARQLADELGNQVLLGAGTAQNLGFLASRKGDYPAALRWLADARAAYEELGSPQRVMVTLESDLCAVLLSGGLYRDAAGAAERAARIAARTGNRLAEAEARLLLARAHLGNEAPAEAERQATQAAQIFRVSERSSWAALAEYVALQAAARGSAASSPLFRRAVTIAQHLAASGWRREALEVRTFAGRTALALGYLDEARAQLGQLAEVGNDGSSGLRATALLATATLHLADGDRAGAKAALSAGMAIVEEHRATLGSTELRAHASINAAELAEMGLELATEDGDPLEVLEWAERWHAGGLQRAPVRAEPDSPLARALGELREVHASVMTGTADPFDDVDPDQRIAALERRVRDLSRATAGRGTDGDVVWAGPDLDGLRRALTGTILVEYFSIDGQLHALVVADDELLVHSLGSLAEIGDEIRKLAAALGRLAYGASSWASLLATRAAFDAVAAGLDERLMAKLALPDRADIVIVPTGPLQGMPWPALPSLAHRPITVAPSACLWAKPAGRRPPPAPTPGDPSSNPAPVTAGSNPAATTGARPARALLVCGAGLPGGEAEIDNLRALYGDAVVLSGPAATVPAVTRAMGQADIVHLAAHGAFRADNPMFSSLGLHDGPLTVYDLEALTHAPTTVILPACDAARSSVRHGDELLGTAAALIQVGVRTVVAPVTVVPDSTVVPPLMAELHRLIRAGEEPARALCRARQSLEASHDDVELATATSFVAIGTSTREW